MSHFYSKVLSKNVSEENALTIVQYVLVLRQESNVSDHYRMLIIKLLTSLASFRSINTNKKLSKEMTIEDIVGFLDSFRKSEAEDSLHKWIGTYNLYRVLLTRFFKWLYYPDIESHKRPKHLVIGNIPELKRKEQSIYRPNDLWTTDDDKEDEKNVDASHSAITPRRQ